jgi:quaternary ammonium compound-resistance protein SugE
LKALDPQWTAWGVLLLAGLLEVGFTTFLTLVNRGHAWAWVGFGICITASFSLLHEATKVIPLGIGYAVWTGIGAAGTLLVSVLFFKASITTAQIAFVVLLIAAIAGIKLSGAPG